MAGPQQVELTLAGLDMGAWAKFNAPQRPRSWSSFLDASLEDTAALLIEFDGFKQRLEISLAKSLVALALNDFKKDRANRVLGEDLQQDAALCRCRR